MVVQLDLPGAVEHQVVIVAVALHVRMRAWGREGRGSCCCPSTVPVRVYNCLLIPSKPFPSHTLCPADRPRSSPPTTRGESPHPSPPLAVPPHLSRPSPNVVRPAAVSIAPPSAPSRPTPAPPTSSSSPSHSCRFSSRYSMQYSRPLQGGSDTHPAKQNGIEHQRREVVRPQASH